MFESVKRKYRFGKIIDNLSVAEPSDNRYGFNGKELIKDFWFDQYDYSARFYSPDLLVFPTIDPLAEKYYHISPYAYCNNNPILYIDPDGESVHLNLIGHVMQNLNDGDNGVYLHYDLSDWDNESDLPTSGAGISCIGYLGDKIDMNEIFENKLAFSRRFALKMDIVDFGHTVKSGSSWDLKVNTNTIWGIAWEFDGDSKHKTKFIFENYEMTAADAGNFHYGYVGKYTYQGEGMSDIVLETGAGAAEIAKNIKDGNYSEAAEGSWQLATLKRPYGDSKADNYWIRIGIWHADKSKK